MGNRQACPRTRNHDRANPAPSPRLVRRHRCNRVGRGPHNHRCHRVVPCRCQANRAWANRSRQAPVRVNQLSQEWGRRAKQSR